MSWLTSMLGSSIGKKLMMALTGLAFCGFLLTHLAGNLTIYGGRDLFNSYADHLISYGILINFAEAGLLTLAMIHIVTGLTLFYQNWNARPIRYYQKKWSGGRTIGSATMPYTGILMLFFVILHIAGFRFVDRTHTTMFDVVSTAFQNPVTMMIYISAVVVVAVHVSHGLWSAFQTLGGNHPKYTPIIKGISLIFSLLVGIGFGFLPIYLSGIL